MPNIEKFSFPNKNYSFGDKVNFDFVSETMSPVFSYQFISFKGEYNFAQNCFDNKDIVSYFDIVQKMSETSLCDIINEWTHHYHFHLLNNPKKELLEIIEKNVVGRKITREEEKPIVAQVGLYTHPEGADRGIGRKSPRIVFLIGKDAILYPICYDPYHEIFNAARKNEKKKRR